MLGPPGSGKTCSQHLLLNEDPPKEAVTDSTPIACRAVKATRISVEAGHMERVDAKALLSRLACDLKEAATAEKKETPPEDCGTKSKESSEYFSESSPNEAKTPESADATESKTEPTKSADKADDSHSVKICRDIVEAIPDAKGNLKCHWVYIVDSGGQTAFQELLPLFTREASLNIITLDLSKGMNEKLNQQYRIDGTPFHCDDEKFSYTNIEFLKDALSSGAILHTRISEKDVPGYFILGTHSDDAKATPQNINKYNEVLSSLKSTEKGYRIISGKLGNSNEIVYPVNTMLESGPRRKAAAENLCNTIYGDISGDEIEMPVRWFAFELTLLEKAETLGCSFLEMDDVLCAGKSLEMTEDDTKQALQHLHKYTIILYYPQVLPNIVFIDPRTLLDILSHLLALTYKIDRKFLHHLTKEAPSQSELDNLSKKGIFTESLLNKLKDDQGFPKSDFIKLLLRLHIICIVKTQNTQDNVSYFIPSALPSYTGPAPGTDINPLLIIWCNSQEILPVPHGIFPLAVVNLMNSESKQPQFCYETKAPEYLRYRDAISFRAFVHNEHIGTIHLVKKRRHIEIYFEGDDERKYFPLIHKAVTEAINNSSVAIDLKPDSHELAFACSKEECYRVVKNEGKRKVECTLCSKPPDISGQEKYWSWFRGISIY